MAGNQVNIVIKAREAASASIDKVRGSLDKLDKSTTGLPDKLKGIGGGIVKLGAVAAVGIAGLAVGAGAVGAAFLGTASKIEQMGAKAKTVFGASLSTVRKWADANATAMGLTSSEATGLAANFGDLLVPMGFTRDQAAKMATEVVGLSGALSQWSGGTVTSAEASDILAKAMLGERDALKGLGISITEADVAARLAKNGTDQLTGAALEQAKAVATQQLIMEKSKDAQTAYAASGDSLLGKQAKLHAMMGTLTEGIATGLTPILHDAFGFIVNVAAPAVGKVIGRVQKWVAENQPLIKQLTAFAGGVLSTVVNAISNVVGWLSTLIGKITSNKDVMNILRGVVGFLADRFGNLTTAVGFVVGAIGGFIDSLTKNRTVMGIFRGVVDGIAGAFRAVQDAVGWVIKSVRDLIGWFQKLGDLKLPFSIPGLASGGPAFAGQTYVVGEKGRELFVPKTDGLVIPADETRTILGGMRRTVAPFGASATMALGGLASTARQVVTHVHHTHLYLDGQEIASAVESAMYYPNAMATSATGPA